MDLGISGRVALVTASSKGLGFASAAALAADGVKVVITGRREDELAAAESKLREAGGEVLALPGDVTQPDEPARLVAAAVEAFGPPTILVANAGGPPPGRSLDVDDDAIVAAVNANLLTTVRLVRAVMPGMRDAGWGRVCAITSFTVKQPVGVLALSNTARTGLYAWMKTAAQDVAGAGITMNMACPGHHATDRMKQLGNDPNAHMGDPADFGKAVAFLCSQPANFITGQAVVIDGGAVLGL